MKKKTKGILIGAGIVTAIASVGVLLRKKVTDRKTQKYLMKYKDELEMEREKTRK